MPCIVEVSSLGLVQISVELVESVGSATCCRASSNICLSYALIKSLSLLCLSLSPSCICLPGEKILIRVQSQVVL